MAVLLVHILDDSDCVNHLKVEDVNKKGSEKDAVKMVDTESVEINKRNVRLFDEVFSADEEVQVHIKLYYKKLVCTFLAIDEAILTFCIRPKL